MFKFSFCFCTAVLLTSTALADSLNCSETPSCAELGFSRADVPGCKNYLHCLFDPSYKVCIERTCDALGFTQTDKTSWCSEIVPCYTDETFTLCAEPSLTTEPEPERSKNCAIGDVYYEDGTCGKPEFHKPSGAHPLGIVFMLANEKGNKINATTSEHGFIVSLKNAAGSKKYGWGWCQVSNSDIPSAMADECSSYTDDISSASTDTDIENLWRSKKSDTPDDEVIIQDQVCDNPDESSPGGCWDGNGERGQDPTCIDMNPVMAAHDYETGLETRENLMTYPSYPAPWYLPSLFEMNNLISNNPSDLKCPVVTSYISTVDLGKCFKDSDKNQVYSNADKLTIINDSLNKLASYVSTQQISGTYWTSTSLGGTHMYNGYNKNNSGQYAWAFQINGKQACPVYQTKYSLKDGYYVRPVARF